MEGECRLISVSRNHCRSEYEILNLVQNVLCVVHNLFSIVTFFQGFFILNCPDLTSLALQLIYLNLSFNDISSFPTEVSPFLLLYV